MRYYINTNMIEKHYIPTDRDTSSNDAPSLPDRSDLSKLYFEPKQSKVTIDEENHALHETQLSSTIRTYALKAGLLIPLPFIITVSLALSFLMVIDSAKIFLALPLMLAWGIGMVIMFRKFAAVLGSIDIPVVTFLSLHISSMLLVTPIAYHFSQQIIRSEWLILIAVSLVMTLFSVAVCWVLLQLILNDSLTNRSKFCLAAIPVVMCIISLTIFLIV